ELDAGACGVTEAAEAPGSRPVALGFEEGQPKATTASADTAQSMRRITAPPPLQDSLLGTPHPSPADGAPSPGIPGARACCVPGAPGVALALQAPRCERTQKRVDRAAVGFTGGVGTGRDTVSPRTPYTGRARLGSLGVPGRVISPSPALVRRRRSTAR